MKKTGRKLLAAILAAGMGFSGLPVSGIVNAQAEETTQEEENALLAWYPLTSDVKDASGNGKDASVPSGADGVTFSDGALTLAGGNSSSKNYVSLPEGLFDRQDAVTVSMWIKNNNTKKNTSAFSFSGKTKQGSYPKHYFILNPSNPDGYYKAVFTDPASGSTANPWNTEVGVNNSKNNSVVTSDKMNQWRYYTVTIDENSLTGYLDGKKVGSDTISNLTVSDFGEKIAAYIGKSDYADDTFAGSFRDLKIYSEAMTQQEVDALYEDAYAVQSVQEAKAGLKLKNGMTVNENLTLPTESGDCAISWTSSNEEALSNDGTVHFQEQSTDVVLTATITCGSYSEDVSYELTVPTEAEAKGAIYKTQLLIPAYVSENLQSEVNGQTIKWSGDPAGLIEEDGTVNAPEKDTKVTVTAKIGEASVTKDVTVLSDGGEILSYVIQGGNLYENTGDILAAKDSRRSDALFLAAKTSSEDTYQELNKGKAVVYVKWDGNQKTSPDNQMGSPILFRKADGSLGAAASGNNNRNGIYVWDTKNNVNFTGERFLTLAAAGTKVQNPSVVYDQMSQGYKVFWEDGAGKSYVSLLDNLKSGSTPSETVETSYTKPEVTGTIPSDAVAEEASVFHVSTSEYEALTKKYGTVYNTGVEDVQITAETGEEVKLPETVTADYNDGSTKKLGVEWDKEALKKLNTSKAGTYEITGTVKQDAYAYPFIEERADPHIFYNEDDGYYYASGSYYEENMSTPSCAQSYRKLDIRRAKTIEGLKDAEEHYILESKVGDRWGGFFWAPEFHKINGTWYCLVGAHDFGTGGITANVNWNKSNWCSKSVLIPYEGTDEQMKAGGMLDPEQWGEPIVLNSSPSFDVSYYEDESGQGYYIMPQNAQLSIVKAAGGEGVVPQPTGSKVVIKSGEWPWEYGVYEGSITASNQEGNDQLVIEGPYLFEYGDKIYISYSAATVDKYYTLGLMMADKGSDIMDPASWTHVTYPALSSYDTYEGNIGGAAHAGGGHNSIVLDEYGNLALIYHARPYPDPHTGQSGSGGLFDPCRHTVVKSVNVAADGTLLFNMTAEEELNPKYKTVTATVTIKKDSEQPDDSGLDKGLLAHYLLESDVKDSSGNQKDAAIASGADGVDFEGSALNLAGGNKNSNNYVNLPDGLFDGQDSVTVSMWINNHNSKGNYSAFFFGSAAQSTKFPLNYFLLNPCNPSGNYKAVFTDSEKSGSPWSTEKGINDSNGKTSTAGFMNQWKLYTVVIKDKTLTGYLDGEKIGTADLSRTVSDFGTGLKAHIGKSQYLDDSLFAGSFRDLRIYGKALSDEDVKSIYKAGETRNLLLEDKEKLKLEDTDNVIADLELPAEGKNGSKITWKSDNKDVISNKGKVTFGTEAQTVTMTATLTIGEESVTKTFTVTVPAADDLENVLKEKLQIPYVITEKTSLPAKTGGADITWKSDEKGLVKSDGTIQAPEKTLTTTITADISYNGKVISKSFQVYVMEKGSSYVMSYTRTGVNAALGESMHLAYSSDGEKYTALHNNTGIFFAKADLTTSVAGTTKTMVTPYLFRMADGRIGVIAKRNDGKVIYGVTKDLMSYEETILSLNTDLAVSEPECEYDGSQYVITWKGSDGKTYKNTTKDFQTISAPEEMTGRSKTTVKSDIANAVPCNVLAVTKAEAKALKAKLMPLENTGVEEKTYAFTTEKGTQLTEEDIKSSITAKYNDGTTDEIPVQWDTSSVDFEKEGTYKITGKAKLTSYPVLNGRADPNIYKYNGKYYFIATGETQNQSQVCIREADTPLGLFSAKDHELIANVKKPRWAPELHEIGGKLYILLAVGDAWNKVQSCMMELKEGGDPTVKSDWTEPVQVTRKDGSALYTDGITLDMTYFEQGGTHYVCWAQRYIGSPNGTSDLWIATIDPENPYKLTSDPVCILRDQYGWDRVDTTVDEGPFVIQNNGKVYLTFSGAGVSNMYVVGLLTADENADLLNPESWAETNYPILSSESVSGEYGPGHSCFSVDEDGRPIFVYHMKPNGGTRSASVRRVHWAADGSPVLDMTIDKELKEEYRTVTGTITVKAKESPDKLAIVTDPSDYKGIVGETAEFTVEAAGEGLTYQWEYCNAGSSKWRTSSMEGSDTATIKVPMGTWRDGQKYRCVVKDAAGNTVTSKAAVMTVGKADTAPVITTQPESVTKNKGEIAEFTVKATGEGLTYQWEYCNAGSDKWRTSSMEGNQTETIKVAAGSWRNGQKYRCVVTGTDGRIVVSEAAVLTVK